MGSRCIFLHGSLLIFADFFYSSECMKNFLAGNFEHQNDVFIQNLGLCKPPAKGNKIAPVRFPYESNFLAVESRSMIGSRTMEIGDSNGELLKAWLDKRYPLRRGAVGPVERIEHMPHSTEYPSSGREDAEQQQREGQQTTPAQPATTASEPAEDKTVIYDRKGQTHPAVIPPSTLDVTG
jgi:hypothetical protein